MGTKMRVLVDFKTDTWATNKPDKTTYQYIVWSIHYHVVLSLKHILSLSRSRKSSWSPMKTDPRFYCWSKVDFRAKVCPRSGTEEGKIRFPEPLRYYLCHYLCLSRRVSRISNSDTRLKNVSLVFFPHAFTPVWCCCVGRAVAGMLG